MNQSIAHLLEIQGYIIYYLKEDEQCNFIFKVGRPNFKHPCPHCTSTKISVHARGDWQLKKHSHFQEKIIFLEVKRHRLRCLSCQKVFSQELPGIAKYARKTKNFEKQSLHYLSKNSFREVGLVNNVSYGLLRDELYKYVNPYHLLKEKVTQLEQQESIYLGLDGQSFRGTEMILTITEVRLHEVLTILPSERQTDLLKFVTMLPLELRLKVKGIAMDMTNKHIKILHEYFPNALIVIDHYHVIQIAIKQMQSVRKTLQYVRNTLIPIKKELDKNREDLTEEERDKLKRYFILFPDIEEAYKKKERIRSLYRISKHSNAQEVFKVIKDELSASKQMEMRELGKTLSNWEKEILNYFKCRITNAYTEGIHTKCKLIKRKSYGFRNVQTYVRKLILAVIPVAYILSLHTC